MAPTIDIIRHAQARHNVLSSNIRDPRLTSAGIMECLALSQDIRPFRRKVTRIFSSPLRRAIETASIGIKPIVGEDIKVILLPELQEINATPSGTGSPKERLIKKYGTSQLDMSALDDDWWHKGPETRFSQGPAKVEARALEARRRLREAARSDAAGSNTDAHILVITHGEFAHWLTEDFVGISRLSKTGWANVELRSYQFADLNGPDTDGAVLVETQESLKRRGLEESPSLSDRQLSKDIASERALAYIRWFPEYVEDDDWVDEDDGQGTVATTRP
ncbi:phosphoglycerate mutase-like protein [Hypoxylon crocopeplum]|nr:phosphoglycerate mutase-like protein [Hypoxylon crocopeplum]